MATREYYNAKEQAVLDDFPEIWHSQSIWKNVLTELGWRRVQYGSVLSDGTKPSSGILQSF